MHVVKINASLQARLGLIIFSTFLFLALILVDLTLPSLFLALALLLMAVVALFRSTVGITKQQVTLNFSKKDKA